MIKKTNTMRNLIATAAALLLLAACGNQQKPVPQREGITYGEVQLGTTDEFDSYEDFTVTYTTTDGFTDTLRCTFPYSMDADMLEFNEGVVGRIEEEDINFDEIPDVQVCTGLFSAYGNPVYEGFVWDTQKGAFVNVPEYAGIVNPYINDSEKSIISMFMEWVYGHQEYTCEKYEWQDGKLVKTDEWYDEGAIDEEEEEDE